MACRSDKARVARVLMAVVSESGSPPALGWEGPSRVRTVIAVAMSWMKSTWVWAWERKVVVSEVLGRVLRGLTRMT